MVKMYQNPIQLTN